MGTMGPTFKPTLDGARLDDQRETIRKAVQGNGWWTLAEIETATGYPQASISAQLRHLKKKQFGGYIVDKRRRHGAALWEYRVAEPVPDVLPGQLSFV